MPKRSGENLARTEDGTTYNKLQRPENWPLEPARRPSGNIEDGSDIDEACNGSLNEETSAQSIPKAKRGKQRLHNHKRKARNTENGCLPMDDDDFSSSDGNGVSFAAIQYLKGVRAQANDLPIVHAAPVDQAQPEEDYRGYYEDGTYTVAPQLGPGLPEYYVDEDDDWNDHEEGEAEQDGVHNPFARISPCEAYTDALLSRFRHLREVIQVHKSDPKLRATANDKAMNVPYAIELRRAERQAWEQKMTEHPPQLSALAVTPLSSLLTLLEIIKKQCMERKQNIRKNISLWVLALLATIDEETIDGDIISDLRELAKKAVWLRIDFEPRFEAASEAMAAEAGYVSKSEPQSDQLRNSSSIVGSDAPEPVRQEADDEILDDLLVDETMPDDETKATLDMVVVIVGEVFGQRDLLESRAVVDWPSGEGELEGEDG